MWKYMRVWLCLAAVVGTLGGCTGRDAETLIYNGPTEQTVRMGESIPGTDLRYVGYSNDSAEVLIADQRALKKVGDSLDWRGTPGAGVDVVLTQRILAANAERLQTVGTVKITVKDVSAVAAQYPDQPALSYTVAVGYTVRKGDSIPGTLIRYTGKTEDGAQFDGVSGYPYRKMGDSVSWMGRLRSNVYLDTTLRVIAYGDDFVTLGGLAKIGLAP